MRALRSLYHLLGGLYCALFLIGATALFVIAGTLLESFAQSHQYAALFTYDTPLFAALLWGFFINILLSATRRWPFRWKHVPFLITHFGLLMILGGVLVKHYYGIQGTMTLLEGTGSHEVLEANTYAIHVEKKGDAVPSRYPLKKTMRGHFLSDIATVDDGLSIRLAEFCPHCKEHLTSWIKGNYATIRGLKPIPLQELTYNSSKESWGYGKAGRDGLTTHVSHDDEELQLGGRVRFASTAPIWDVYAFKTADPERTFRTLYLQHSHPFLAVMQEDGGDIHLIACNPDREVWSESFPQGRLNTLVAYDDGFAGYSSHVELPFDAHSAQKNSWKEALSEELVTKLRQAVADHAELPAPLLSLKNACAQENLDFPETAANLLVPLLQPQHAAQLLGDAFGVAANDNERHSTPLSFEASVIPVHEPLPPGNKLEEHIPKVSLFVRQGKRSQTISLAYERSGTGLKWPILDGSYLVRFQPQFHEIPYRVRLRRARQINYPNSTQPYSFESDLIVTDRHTLAPIETTISMNRVYETWDGYRFYLSAMTPADETAVKQVQIAVNYDPAKYLLTYPGAMILSCGILLLFVLRPYSPKP